MAATPPPLGKGARISGAQRSDLSTVLGRRYQAGESIRSMAADVGRSYGFVQGLLKEHGVELRTRGGATRGAEAIARRAAVQQQVEVVRARLANGAARTGAETADDAEAPPRVKKAKAEKAGKKDKPGKKGKKSKKDKSAKAKKDKKAG